MQLAGHGVEASTKTNQNQATNKDFGTGSTPDLCGQTMRPASRFTSSFVPSLPLGPCKSFLILLQVGKFRAETLRFEPELNAPGTRVPNRARRRGQSAPWGNGLP